jgi:hypothetical protein
MKISRNKTDFGGRYQEFKGMRRPMAISSDVIGEFESFKYLG